MKVSCSENESEINCNMKLVNIMGCVPSSFQVVYMGQVDIQLMEHVANWMHE